MTKRQTVNLARGLRQRETEPEQILWSWLRTKQLEGIKFRRQEPIGNYIVDFVSFDKKLIIELDSGQHNEDNIALKDTMRTDWLAYQGFKVIRFWNDDVLSNLDGVMIKIIEALE
jgi:very-short-patch-repair endonuclease